MMPKVLYEVDPHNRLVIKKTGRQTRLKRFRQVVHGRFRTDSKNKLYYEVYKPSGTAIPQRIKFAGKYSLDKRRNLILTLHEWRNQRKGDRLRLRTKLIDADGSEIVFLLSSRRPKRGRSSYIMKLHGAWQADKNNRLTFGVKRERDKVDNLTLFNAWKISKNNEIVYSYGHSKIITLKGRWYIKDKYRLSYILDKGISSGFDFRTSLGRIVPRRKKTYIHFDIAIDISKRKRIKRRLIFTFKRKMKRGKVIILEVSPRKRSASLKLTKEILDKKGVAYIESILSDRERYLGGGLAFGW